MLFLGIILGFLAYPQVNPPREYVKEVVSYEELQKLFEENKKAMVTVPILSCPACPETPDCVASFVCEKEIQTFYQNHSDYAECSNLNNNEWLTVSEGFSMQPFISGYNKVKAVKYITGMKVRQGNIIIFDDLKGSPNTIHAIAGVYPDYLITQGYNNNSTDGRISYSQIKYIITDVRFC